MGTNGRPHFDPPLRDRLLWREPLSPQTLISEDRGLIARTFGTLSLLGAVLGLLILALHRDGRNNDIVAAVVAAELAVGVISFIGYRRLPIWFFHLALLLATALICVSATIEPVGAEGVLSLYVVWLVLLAHLFFTRRAALAQSLFAVAALSAVMFARGDPFAINYAVATLTIMCAAGFLVGFLRARLERMAASLERDARTDAVTGLLNRRGFNDASDRELARLVRGGEPLSLIAADLDHFKRVNDELGHDQGDAALRVAAEAISDSVRGIDQVGRLGGEEFGVLLPGADELEAIEIAERVRGAVRDSLADHPVPVTISCGVSTVSGPVPREDLLRSSDEALYEAKRRGRDRTVATAANGNGHEKRVVFAV